MRSFVFPVKSTDHWKGLPGLFLQYVCFVQGEPIVPLNQPQPIEEKHTHTHRDFLRRCLRMVLEHIFQLFAVLVLLRSNPDIQFRCSSFLLRGKTKVTWSQPEVLISPNLGILRQHPISPALHDAGLRPGLRGKTRGGGSDRAGGGILCDSPLLHSMVYFEFKQGAFSKWVTC